MHNHDSGLDLISEEEMRALIEKAAEEVGGKAELGRKLRMKSPAPIYLALQGDRAVGDDLAMRLGYMPQRMYGRIGNGAQK